MPIRSQLMVKSSALELMDDALFFRGEPFSGIAFEEAGGLIVDATVFKQGESHGPYRSPFFETPRNAARVVDTCPQIQGSKDYPEIIQFLLGGEVFSGVYYEFQNEFCIYEGLIVDGFPKVQTEWHCNGDIASYEGPEGDFEFDHGFVLSYLCISNGTNCSLSVQFEAGAITSVRVLGNIFSELAPIAARMPFQFITRNSDLLDYKAGSRLHIVDLHPDDGLFASMLDTGFLAKTTELIFSPDVLITPEQLRQLGALRRLMALDIYDRNRCLEAAVLELRLQRPDLQINYKGL